MIQAAVNGNRYEECIPVSTEGIVRSSIEAVQQGAGSIHFHVRNSEGKEILEEKWVGEQVSKLKENLPQTPIGIST